MGNTTRVERPLVSLKPLVPEERINMAAYCTWLARVMRTLEDSRPVDESAASDWV